MNENIIIARKSFAYLEKTTSCLGLQTIEDIAKKIKERLAEDHADFAALDETGSSSAEEMKKRFETAKARMHLIAGRGDFDYLENMNVPLRKDGVDEIISGIKEHLKRSGAQISALDTTGRSSSEQMEYRFQAAMIKAYAMIPQADQFFGRTGSIPATNTSDHQIIFSEASNPAKQRNQLGRTTKNCLNRVYQVARCLLSSSP